ncbi:MAG TPA: type I-D CRISPR-associated helicase Cas3' [Halomicronema sp.]
MTTKNLAITLEPRSIPSAVSLPDELQFMGNALQHQVDVFEQARNADIILDLAPTGTGKTKAGLAVVLHNPTQNAIYIAPTNALVEQQKEAAEKFVQDAGLPHLVKAVTAREIKSWPDDRVGKRSGEKLYNVLRNPATVFDDVEPNQPVLLVINPDIFYYATFFSYNRLDKINLASMFFASFGTVIFDEFHLYDAKQLVGLLFYLAYSLIFGFFQNGRKIVLLTATPEKACEAALQTLQEKGLKIARIDGETGQGNLLPSQTAVNLELRSKPDDKTQWVNELANEVIKRLKEQPSQNGAVILDSLDNINLLAKLLREKGFSDVTGRITGPAPKADRQRAMQCQIILATSTVDVGFNFERNPAPQRQNLDWLIFSARDRAAFWQRIGRVGRVLGKSETDIPSQAIAYLPTVAWEQGLSHLDCAKGRFVLTETLNNLACLDKAFLVAYWRSEAFLEIARPLLEMEELLTNLPNQKVITQLFETLQEILGGGRSWKEYRYRMQILRAAEQIVKIGDKPLKEEWKYIKGGQAFVKKFMQLHYAAEYEEIETGIATIEQYEEEFQSNLDAANQLKEFANIWATSYAPLFQFRSSLFESLTIRDPQGFLLDESEQTVLDPIHLLRYYEFVQKNDWIEVTNRVKTTYQLSFRLRYYGNQADFVSQELNKLTAFANCSITRQLNGAIAPTPLVKELEKRLLPGVIICPIANAAAFYQLRREGIESYPILICCNDKEKEYRFLPGIYGILAMAMKSKQLRLPDNEPLITSVQLNS